MENVSEMTEMDLGSDFSDQEPDSTSDLGMEPGRYPSLNLGPNAGFSSNLFQTTSSSYAESSNYETRKPLAYHVTNFPVIVAAIPGDETSATEVVSLNALPKKYRSFFDDYNYFNIIQSKVFYDVFHCKNSIAISSPTGSGKTVIMEIAILKELADHDRTSSNQFSHKIIYMAPTKAICEEKFRDWNAKFPRFGVNVCQITGDSEEKDYGLVYKSNLIVTTPEKWDAITRKWKRERQSLMSSVKLVLIDEVHQLSDSGRGPCLEAVITRIKTAKKDIRFIAVSASAPNIKDVATWLGRSETDPELRAKFFQFGEEYRPIKLNSFVKGYPKYGTWNDFLFDKQLEKHVPALVNEHSQYKPTLVFCMTRKSCVDSAKTMAGSNTLSMTASHREVLRKIADRLKDPILRDLVPCGIAFYHAGVEHHDREMLITAFTASQVLVLFCTSALAIGVNLPAHLVIVKGTVRIANQSTIEYSETDIQQMIGRAGRPQYDESGTAIIMTSDRDKLKYEKLLRGEKVLESYIHQKLPEHLNAEIVLETITNIQAAVAWLHATFYYIRCRINRSAHYGLEVGLSDVQVERRLNDMIISDVNGLVKYKMVTVDAFAYDVRPTEVGKLMAHFYMSFDTMKTFVTMKPKLLLKDVLQIICNCKELAQDMDLRNEDKKYLFSFHCKNKNEPSRQKVRFDCTDKIKSRAQKINTLLQIEFGMIHEEFLSKYRSDTLKLIRGGTRIARCLAEYAILQETVEEKGFTTVRSCIILSKCFQKGLWENTPFVAKQFDGIGPKYARDLKESKLTTIESIANCDPRIMDGILNRRNHKIINLARKLPKYNLVATQVLESQNEAKIELEISILNWEEVSTAPTAGKHHSVYLLVGDEFDKVLVAKKVKDEEMLSGNPFSCSFTIKKHSCLDDPNGSKGTEFQVSVLSESWIGIDLPKEKFAIGSFPYFKKNVCNILIPHNGELPSGPSADSTSTVKSEVAGTVNQDDDFTEENFGAPSPATCKHTCKKKDECKHDCCKNGPKTATKKRKTDAPTLVKSNITKQINFFARRDTTDGNRICSAARKGIHPVAASAATSSFVPEERGSGTLKDEIQVKPELEDGDMVINESKKDGTSSTPIQGHKTSTDQVSNFSFEEPTSSGANPSLYTNFPSFYESNHAAPQRSSLEKYRFDKATRTTTCPDVGPALNHSFRTPKAAESTAVPHVPWRQTSGASKVVKRNPTPFLPIKTLFGTPLLYGDTAGEPVQSRMLKPEPTSCFVRSSTAPNPSFAAMAAGDRARDEEPNAMVNNYALQFRDWKLKEEEKEAENELSTEDFDKVLSQWKSGN